MKFKLFCTMIFSGLVLLTACGIKPGEVDPPQGKAADKFPRVYPDPSTDPK